ncbi:dephospho-CoA kinase [Pseudocolwellia sp. AS88]|uniref:dephospho-CoA kinase n=1 Tax=Pseudocolwellia sp. AS88 TaxID=3063958 RepID=UPI0026EB2B67|nr:dephospho-CoA kinase [Pseudocolwellia sp. AS88]MDO7086464.1 dephospho-CoA kinase [Pseudocolwellia sp. AS88]
MKKLVVGLTGGIGSGKTTVANMFHDLGVELVDADIIAREVVEPNSFALDQIKQHFGDDFIQADGYLDRTKLRHKIFSSELDKQWLNALLHPLIRESILSKISESSGQYCILVAPLLFENELTQYVNRTLVVDVTESIQIERTVKRDNSNSDIIEKIIASQISRTQRLKLADDIIDNSTTNLSLIAKKVDELHHLYLSYA